MLNFLDVVADPFLYTYGSLIWVIIVLVALLTLIGLFIWRKRKQKNENNKPGTPNSQQ